MVPPVSCRARQEGMFWDKSLSGRKEKRLPIALVVRLVSMEQSSADGDERACTDNLSPHGVRVQSRRRWHPGEEVEVVPANREPAMRGEVVYCEKLNDDRFFIGLTFPQKRIPWSILQRYDGT